MNLKEAYRALVNGEKVRGTEWPEDWYVCMSSDGTKVVDECGDEYLFDADDGPVFEVFTKKNPHTRGTLLWAHFEVTQNGKKTAASGLLGHPVFREVNFRRTTIISLEAALSTDWTVQ